MNVTQCIEEAAELGDRFPELYDSEAYVTVCDILGLDWMQYAESSVERVILSAYHGGKTAGRRTAHAYGLYEESVS